MGCSVHKIQYHPTMQVYAVLVSTPEPFLIRDENGMPIDGEDRGRFYSVCLFVVIKSKWSAELYLSQFREQRINNVLHMCKIDFRVYYNYFYLFQRSQRALARSGAVLHGFSITCHLGNS